jgi:hypothetical protein
VNIYILDVNPRLCAMYYCDQHITETLLETAQVMSIICRREGFSAGYGFCYEHHPCVVWAGASLNNWLWLRSLAKHLNHEYQFRWPEHEGHHPSYVVAQTLPVPELLPRLGVTPFVAIVPETCRVSGNAVASYRNWYIRNQLEVARWTRTRVPFWLVESLRKEGKEGVIKSLSPNEEEVKVNTFSKHDAPVRIDPFQINPDSENLFHF